MNLSSTSFPSIQRPFNSGKSANAVEVSVGCWGGGIQEGERAKLRARPVISKLSELSPSRAPAWRFKATSWSMMLMAVTWMGLTAFQATDVSASDAPSLNSAANVYLAPVAQNAGAPSGAVGTSISTLVDFAGDSSGLHNNVTDPDSGAQLGVAVTIAETSNGTWHYSIDGGSSWSALGTVSDSNARLLLANANTRIYFQPTSGFSGTLSTALTFRAWDATSGSNGGLASTSSNGGSTAFSTGTDTASITVHAANTAPVLASIESVSFNYSENAGVLNVTTNLTVTDSANLISAVIQITGNYVRGEDVLEFANTGAIQGTFDWVGGKLTLTGTDTVANYQTALRAVKYRNLSDAPSTATRTVSFTVNDGGGVDSLSNVAARDITVSTSNDAPAITATADQTINEDTATGEIVFVLSDPEADAVAALYDNTVNPNPQGLVVFPGNGIEFGDQVSLSGLDRLAVDFMFGVYLAGTATGSEKAELFIRRNDGVNNSPYTLLYQSGEFSLSGGVNLLSVPGFSLTLPDTFTWSVVFSGVPGSAGLLVYDPPSVGASLGDFWQKNGDGSWTTHLVSSGTVDANFAARIAKASSLTVTKSSSNQAVVPDSNIVLRDSGSTRTVTVTPLPNVSGFADITLTVSDGTASASDTFRLTVTAVNDAPIRTAGTVANLTVNENAAATSLGLGGLAYSSGPADESGQGLTYKVTAVPPSSLGQVLKSDETTVVNAATLYSLTELQGMKFRPALNENGGPSAFSFEVKDTGGTAAGAVDTLVESLTVSVGSVNTPPAISAPTPTQTVNEDTTLALAAFNGNALSITDVDAGANDVQLTLSVSHGNIMLDNTSGLTFVSGANDSPSITVLGTLTELNNALGTVFYKPTPNYFGSDTLALSANDQGFSGAGGAQTGTASVNISVVAVNDAPSFIKGIDQTVTENTGAGSGVVTVPNWATAVSSGAGESQTLTFHLTSDNPGLFSVQPAINVTGTTGTLTFTPAPSGTGIAHLTVTLKDNGGVANGGSDSSPPQNFVISVGGINDPPTLDPIVAPTTIAEDVGEQFVSLTGISAGPNEFQNLSVTATSSNPTLIPNPLVSYFTPSSVGSVRFAPAPNQSGSAIITVTVADDSTAGGSALSVQRTFTVNVSAVNDRPEITGPTTQTIEEDTILFFASTNANLISVGDVDVTGNPVLLTLSVANGTLDLGITNGLTFPTGGTGGLGTSTVFVQGPLTTVNASLGSLKYKPNLDVHGFDVLVLSAEDLGSTGSGGPQSGTRSITINITPVNDLPAIGANQVFNVPENAFVSTLVGHVVAEDFEQTGLTYVLMTTGNTGNAFSLDHWGDLRVNAPLNFESRSSYTLSILVTDTSGASANGTITVNVVNLNDPPVATDVVVTYPESTAISTVLGSVVATDEDTSGPNATRQFAITQGNWENNFAMNPTTGQITLINPLNYEQLGSHVFEVTVSDGGSPPLSDKVLVTVNVTDVNEEPVMEDLTLSVSETAPVGTHIGTMHAIDFDFGSSVTYSISSGNVGTAFSIHPTLGHVTVNNALNAETLSTYGLQVTATDSGSPVKSRTAVLTVNVVDVNRPAVTTAPADQNVMEDGTLVFSTGTNNRILITDDAGTTGEIEVSLSVDHGSLTLASTSGIDFRIGVNGTSRFRIRGVLSAMNSALNGLMYRPDLDFNGVDALGILTDDRGTGGLGGTYTDFDMVVLHVKPLIDGGPVVTVHPEIHSFENLTAVEVHRNLKDGPEVTHFQITGISNGTLYLSDAKTVVNSGNFLTDGEAGAGLRFKPTSSATAGGFMVRASLNDIGTGADSGLGGDPVTVTIQPNQLPVAQAQTLTTPEDMAIPLVLEGHDPEGRDVQFSIVSFPTKGELVPSQTSSLPGREYVYIPNGNAFGPDSFTFKVSDGFVDSAPAAVNVQVIGVNDSPTLVPLPNIAVKPNSGARTIPLTGISGGPANEAQVVTVTAISSNSSVVSVPSNGVTLADPPVAGSLTFEPASGLVGTNAQITVTVSDGGTTNGTISRMFNVAITDRTLRIVNRKSMAGNVVDVPVEMQSQGGENAVAFSIRFNPAVLSLFQVAPGTNAVGASLNVNTSFSGEGRFGVALALPSGEVFASGPKQVAILSFFVRDETAAMTLTSTPVEFDNGPVHQEVVNAEAVHLPAVFENGFLQISRGFEADVADRPFGSDNGFVTPADWTQVGLFAAQLQDVESASEFQRTDCAPREVEAVPTLGNGVISLADWVQAGRYAAGLDPVTAGGGPFGPVQLLNGGIGNRSVSLKSVVSSSSRVRILNAAVESGKSVVVRIAMDSIGKENALGFSLNFDTQAIQFVSARTGLDAQGGTLLTNSREASRGRVGFALALAPGQSFGAGPQQVAEIEFVSSSAGVATETSLAFADAPIPREIVSFDATELRGTYESAVITIKGGLPSQPVQPSWKLSLARLSPQRDVELRLTGNPGSGFVIETSADLIQWTILKTVTLESATVDVVDPEARKLSGRFYRARPTP